MAYALSSSLETMLFPVALALHPTFAAVLASAQGAPAIPPVDRPPALPHLELSELEAARLVAFRKALSRAATPSEGAGAGR